MPRSRGSEAAQPPPPPPPQQQQRQSPRAPLHLRTTNSEPNGAHAHHRGSPKLEDSHHRRSPRSPLREFSSCNQKRRVGRVTDLETKLGHVQEELGKLREQLASAEAAKRDAQRELEEAKKKLTPAAAVAGGREQAEEPHVLAELHGGEHLVEAAASPAEEDKKKADSPDITAVPAAAPVDPVIGKEEDSADYVLLEDKDEGAGDGIIDIDEKEGEEEETAAAAMAEAAEALTLQEALATPALEAKLEETIGELERCLAENAGLKKQLEEAEASAAAARSREEEAARKLTHAEEELAGSKAKADQLGEQLEAAEGARSSLEAEMRRLKIQSEQWRKAADAAVAALSVTGGLGAEADGRRMAERCGSMDKHLGAGCTGEFGGLGSPTIAADHLDDRWGAAGKRKGAAAGIRMFGDLWKKKGQQK